VTILASDKGKRHDSMKWSERVKQCHDAQTIALFVHQFTRPSRLQKKGFEDQERKEEEGMTKLTSTRDYYGNSHEATKQPKGNSLRDVARVYAKAVQLPLFPTSCRENLPNAPTLLRRQVARDPQRAAQKDQSLPYFNRFGFSAGEEIRATI